MVYPFILTLMFSARNFMFFFKVTHVSIFSSDMLNKRLCRLSLLHLLNVPLPEPIFYCFNQMSVFYLDPLHFRCLFLKIMHYMIFDHWAFTLSLKDGCFQAYFMAVLKKFQNFILDPWSLEGSDYLFFT